MNIYSYCHCCYSYHVIPGRPEDQRQLLPLRGGGRLGPGTKNSKQRRTYIGKCDKDGNLIKESIRNRTIIVSKTFGPHYLMLELLARYRKRGDVEDDFGVLKADLEGGVKHMSSNDAAEGLILVEFMALILKTVLLSRIRDSELKGKVWVPDVFGILNKLKITRIGDEWRLNEVTKRQRELYTTLGAEPPSGVHR